MRACLLAASLGLALVSGCAQIADQLEGAEADETDGVDPVAVVETVEWAQLDGLVSVLVRNTTQRMLRRAEAVITLRNADGEDLAAGPRRVYEGPCCTAADVPPGATFGLYVYTGDPATKVEDVEVRYKNVAWGAAAGSGGPVAGVRPVRLGTNPLGTLVVAEVTAVGGLIESAVVQAVLEDPTGELVAVISGSWTCFRPGPATPIRMQLYHPAPPDTQIRSITVYPDVETAGDGDANLEDACEAA